MKSGENLNNLRAYQNNELNLVLADDLWKICKIKIKDNSEDF